MIRYDKKLNTEINKIIRNFNSKIKRLEKSDKQVLIPQKITKKEITKDVTNRKELKRKLNELKLFSKRGIENIQRGTNISNYELKLIKLQKQRVTRRLNKEIDNLSIQFVEISGKRQGITLAQMGDEHLSNLKARRQAILNKSTANLDNDSFKALKNLLDKTEKNFDYKDEVFKENYLNMLLNEGYFYGFDQKKLDEIHDKIKGLSTKEFLDLFYKDKAIQKVLDFSLTDIAKNEKRANYNPNYFYEAMDEIDNLYENLYENIDTIVSKYKK